MIGTIKRGDDPRGALAYIFGARKSLTPERIAIGNLVSLETAAAEIESTIRAAPNARRIKNPLAHIILGWAPEENPSVAQQIEAGRRLLKRLRLIKHQYLIGVHDEAKCGLKPGLDGRHFEAHIAVNRVRRDGFVEKLAFDFAEVERACADIARELGFRIVPGRFNGMRDQNEHQGLGNRIGSVVAHSGRPSIADEMFSDPERIAALRRARKEGWTVLTEAFREQGLGLVIGKGRRRADLHPGLVMVDLAEPARRLKLSALDRHGEKWGANHLEAELGPMPPGCAYHADMVQALLTAQATPSPPAATISPPDQSIEASFSACDEEDLATEIHGNPARIAALRAARNGGTWQVLIDAFADQGLLIEPGFNAKRGTESGLVMVDRRRPERRQALSKLDRPTEKWGRSALEALLGPWPGGVPAASRDQSSPHRTAAARDAASPKPSPETSDRKQVWRDFQVEKDRVRAHNRGLTGPHRDARAQLSDAHRHERDGHYRLRRVRRAVVRGLFGRRSITAGLINTGADFLFDKRMRRCAEAQRVERTALRKRHAAERLDQPSWPQYLRHARQQHDARRALRVVEAGQEASSMTPDAPHGSPIVHVKNDITVGATVYGVWSRTWPRRPVDLEARISRLAGADQHVLSAEIDRAYARRFGTRAVTKDDKTSLRAACLFAFQHPSNAPLAALHDEAKRWLREQDAPTADRASQSPDASVPAQPSAEEVERPSTHRTNPAPSDTETAVQAVPGNTTNRTSADASRSNPDDTLVDVTLASQVIRSRHAMSHLGDLQAQPQPTDATVEPDPVRNAPRTLDRSPDQPSRTTVEPRRADQEGQPATSGQDRGDRAVQNVETNDRHGAESPAPDVQKRGQTILRKAPDVRVVGVEAAVGRLPIRHGKAPQNVQQATPDLHRSQPPIASKPSNQAKGMEPRSDDESPGGPERREGSADTPAASQQTRRRPNPGSRRNGGTDITD